MTHDPYLSPFRLSRSGEPCRMEGGTEQRLRRDEAIEPGRLRRAVARLPFVVQVGPRQFHVKGNAEPWYAVDLDVDPPCYCKDVEIRRLQCLHELSCRLKLREPQVVQALGDLLLQAERNLAQAMRRTKRKKGAA